MSCVGATTGLPSAGGNRVPGRGLIGAAHDDGAAGVVHALAQQVLPEAALLALQHVAERLQPVVARARDGPTAAAVVDQRVACLLEHPLLVATYDLRRAELEQPLEAVVAV